MDFNIKYNFVLFGLIFFFGVPAFAQDTQAPAQEEAAYQKVITERASKIVEPLALTDAAKTTQARDIIAQQYNALRKIHDDRDKKLVAVKTKAGEDKNYLEEQSKKIQAKAKKQQDKLHKKYLAKLANQLTPEQVDQVKDGMTYGALPKTYRNYLAMLPDLTQEQKTQIWNWLSEARELAMDGGSSQEKLGMFGKYKGKITNYLTAAGYNLKKSEAEWLSRIKLAETAHKITQTLSLTDTAKAKRVQNIVYEQYLNLKQINTQRDAQVEASNKTASTNKEASDAAVIAAWEEAKKQLNTLHVQYLAQLAAELTPDQIDKVKDGMTDGGLQQEYTKFNALLPNLTEEQKAKIMVYLVEARENAMDAGSPKEIRQWFAKYRGRANNYLSAAGYDLRKATEELKKKQEATTPSKGN